jgi:hypothetical protein
VTIRKGQAWGTPGPLSAGAPVVDDDAGAAEHLQVHWSPEAVPIEVGVLGGDLHVTVGEPHHDEDDLRAGRGMRLPMDLGTVSVDGGEPLVFVAHMIATERPDGRLWSSRTITVLNGSFAGPANLGPRAHPNDGRLDVLDGTLPRAQRRTGRRRALTGTHVPHPDLAERRTAHHVVDSDVPLHLRLDGRPAGSGTRLEITCHPDAWIAVV